MASASLGVHVKSLSVYQTISYQHPTHSQFELFTALLRLANTLSLTVGSLQLKYTYMADSKRYMTSST
jgi:hypothetical protein